MNFISIPKNGASWRNSLLYSVATADGKVQDFTIEIYLSETAEIIGRKVVYGVASAEFDIAPYLRSALTARMANSHSAVAMSSPSALRVYVVVNGVASETRIFFRERFDISKQQVLTLLPDNQSINHGGVIRFSVYAQRNLRVVVTRRTPESEHTDTLVAMTHSLPHEVIIPTADFDPKTTNVEVVVWCDAQPIKRLNYRVIEPPSSAVRLVWYNAMGGVDSYLFLHSHRVEYKAVVTDVTVDGELSSTFRAGEVVRRLTTLPASNEMEALAQIVYSDRVYCEVDGELTPVRLITRSLSFDEHDAIHRLSIDIKANWRGGEL